MTGENERTDRGTKLSRHPRILLAAGASGSGKTLITCGLLQALRDRGLCVSSFKCGPDYIDPMFHARVIGSKARNLDTFFTDEETTRYLFAKGAEGTDVSVLEGVMGYYDGLGGVSARASSYELACVTDTPAVLIVNCRGMSLSLLAYVKGFLEFREDSHIRGVILNQCSARMYPAMKDLLETELGVRVYGYVPQLPELQFKSRHLGLVTPDEVEGLRENLRKLGQTLEQTLEVDGLLELAQTAPDIGGRRPRIAAVSRQHGEPDGRESALRVARDTEAAGQHGEPDGRESVLRIAAAPVVAVARDEAFCFLYEENLDLLRELGAEVKFFSPLRDERLPRADGLLLYGGYPELYARQLSGNCSMRESIRDALRQGLPCMAECGGFLYLQEELEDLEGNSYAMVGALPGRSFYTKKLSRFGYVTLRAAKEQMLGTDVGEIRAHEFHYYDSTVCGDAFRAQKALRPDGWDCMQGNASCVAGYPHLYYYSNPNVALRFLERCAQYRSERGAIMNTACGTRSRSAALS